MPTPTIPNLKKYYHSIDLRYNQLVNAKVVTPVNGTDISNKEYVDDKTEIFVIDNFDNFAIDYPLAKRVSGKIFLVKESTIVDGSGNTIPVTDMLYYFDALLDYLPITENTLKQLTHSLTYNTGIYSTLLTDLNNLYKFSGKIVLIQPLDICVIFDGTDWNYLSGDMVVTNVSQYNTVPNQFKISQNITIVNGITKVILSDKTLSDVVIISGTIPMIPENNRYYLINGVLHYSISGTVYPLTNKIKIFESLLLESGENQIQHNLNSIYIFCYLRIYSNNLDEQTNPLIMVDYETVSENIVKINSSYSEDLIVDLFIINHN